MKFGKLYEERLSQYGRSIVSESFAYGRLKKLMKGDETKAHDAAEIAKLQRELWREWRGRLRYEISKCQRLLFPSWGCFRAPLNDSDVQELCELYTAAFRKMCKKLQKHLELPALAFFCEAARSHQYAFLGSAKRAALGSGRAECDCPVCLSTSNDFLILRCGHKVCAQCVQAMWRADPDSETQLANAALQAFCPMCRAGLACHPFFAIRCSPRLSGTPRAAALEAPPPAVLALMPPAHATEVATV